MAETLIYASSVGISLWFSCGSLGMDLFNGEEISLGLVVLA
jgi:hypothetical protein